MLKLKEITKEFNYLNSMKASSFEEVFISGISTPDYPVENTLLFVKDKKFFDLLKKIESDSISKKIILIVPSSLELEVDLKNFSYILSEKSIDQAMVDLSHLFFLEFEKNTQCLLDGRQVGNTKIDPTVEIAQGVFIGENVEVDSGSILMPGSVIMPGCKLGKNVKVYPRVTIYPGTCIGNDVIIHSGTIVGCDGFGYNQINGEHKKVFHLGSVIIDNDVEIGANYTIDRGTFGPTIIGKGSKLDNLVHIAHNCILGEKVNCS